MSERDDSGGQYPCPSGLGRPYPSPVHPSIGRRSVEPTTRFPGPSRQSGWTRVWGCRETRGSETYETQFAPLVSWMEGLRSSTPPAGRQLRCRGGVRGGGGERGRGVSGPPTVTTSGPTHTTRGCTSPPGTPSTTGSFRPGTATTPSSPTTTLLRRQGPSATVRGPCPRRSPVGTSERGSPSTPSSSGPTSLDVLFFGVLSPVTSTEVRGGLRTRGVDVYVRGRPSGAVGVPPGHPELSRDCV